MTASRMRPRTATVLLTGIAALMLGIGAGVPAQAAIKHAVYRYPSESKAQKHCPQDEIVYGSRQNGRYYEKGDPHYGHIKNAVYVCRHEADRGGWHPQAH